MKTIIHRLPDYGKILRSNFKYLSCTRRSRFKNLRLHISRQIGINWQNHQLFDFGSQFPCSFLHNICNQYYSLTVPVTDKLKKLEIKTSWQSLLRTSSVLQNRKKFRAILRTSSISWADSISSCPVRKTRISPRGWVIWIWRTDTTTASM